MNISQCQLKLLLYSILIDLVSLLNLVFNLRVCYSHSVFRFGI
jgi:hypothetical protein